MCILFTPPVFSILFCRRWWWLFRSNQQWGNTEKGKGQQWELSCLLQNQPVQLSSELPGGKSHLCWKESSPPYCNTALEDEQRCWPWSSRKESVLISSVQCYNCFWGCSVEGCSCVCCGKMGQYPCFLLPESLQSNTVQQVQLTPLGYILPLLLKCSPKMPGCLCGLV